MLENDANQERKKSRIIAYATIFIILCMIGSASFAFIGTYLANKMDYSKQNLLVNTDDKKVILYQAVLRKDSKDIIEPLSIEDVVANIKYSVVQITTETLSTSGYMRQFVSTGAGSGVIISSDGYIVTNHHVIDGAQTIEVILSNNQLYEALLVASDSKTDLAILKIEASNLQPAILGYSADLLVGQSAIAIGNPLGELGGTVTSGIISALDREITIDGQTMSLLQTDTAINPGNSGGGLFNLYGELVGIVNAKSSGSEIEGLGFAIPIDTARVVIEDILEYGYVRNRIDTGFVLVDIQDALTARSYRISQLGLYIAKSADKNFQSGDRITAVEGQKIESLADWNKEMNNFKVGVTIVRNGSSTKLLLILTELKTT